MQKALDSWELAYIYMYLPKYTQSFLSQSVVYTTAKNHEEALHYYQMKFGLGK